MIAARDYYRAALCAWIFISLYQRIFKSPITPFADAAAITHGSHPHKRGADSETRWRSPLINFGFGAPPAAAAAAAVARGRHIPPLSQGGICLRSPPASTASASLATADASTTAVAARREVSAVDWNCRRQARKMGLFGVRGSFGAAVKSLNFLSLSLLLVP